MTSAASIAATEKKCRSELPTERREILHFSLQRLLSRPDSWSPFPPPRSATLSRRIALVSLRLFSSISGFRSASDPAGAQVLVVRRRMLLASPVLPQSLPPPSISMSPPSFALLSPLSFFTFILHGITSGDDGIPESKTRSFDFVEILKDVVDLLFSTALQLPRFQTVQPIFPSSPPLTLPSLAIGLP